MHAHDTGNHASVDGLVAPGHVTNYAQNEDGRVWDLRTLRLYLAAQHGGRDVWTEVWRKIEHCTALLFAASLPRVQVGSSRLLSWQ